MRIAVIEAGFPENRLYGTINSKGPSRSCSAQNRRSATLPSGVILPGDAVAVLAGDFDLSGFHAHAHKLGVNRDSIAVQRIAAIAGHDVQHLSGNVVLAEQARRR